MNITDSDQDDKTHGVTNDNTAKLSVLHPTTIQLYQPLRVVTFNNERNQIITGNDIGQV